MSSTTTRLARLVHQIAVAASMALALALLGPASSALAQDAGPDGPRIISVAGTGFAEAEPDAASIRLGVTARGQSAERATAKAATAMESVIAALLDAGVDEDAIRTTRLDLRQERVRDPETDRRVPSGWVVQNRVSATITEIDRIGDIVDAAITAGATNVERLRFRASDPAAALAEARESAVAAAELTARQLASASGVQVGDVLSIQEGGARSPYPFVHDAALEARAAAGPTPVLPGTIDIAVTVYVVYAIS